MSAVARDMDDLFGAVAGASERVMIVRERARADVVASIRELERALREAIRGDTLRGMMNLSPTPDRTVQGMRVVIAGGRPDAKVPFGRRALVLGKDGTFLSLVVDERGGLKVRPAHDDDFFAQDLDAVLHTVGIALERHIRCADRTVKNYERLVDLATALTGALRPNPGVRST